MQATMRRNWSKGVTTKWEFSTGDLSSFPCSGNLMVWPSKERSWWVHSIGAKILMSTFYWCCLCFCWSEFIILQFSFNRGRQTAVKDYGCTKEVCFSIGSVLAGMVHYSTKWILDCKMPRFRGQFALEILIFDRLCPSYSGIKNLNF